MWGKKISIDLLVIDILKKNHIKIIYWYEEKKCDRKFLIRKCMKRLYRFEYVCVGSLFRSIEYYKQ